MACQFGKGLATQVVAHIFHAARIETLTRIKISGQF